MYTFELSKERQEAGQELNVDSRSFHLRFWAFAVKAQGPGLTN